MLDQCVEFINIAVKFLFYVKNIIYDINGIHSRSSMVSAVLSGSSSSSRISYNNCSNFFSITTPFLFLVFASQQLPQPAPKILYIIWYHLFHFLFLISHTFYITIIISCHFKFKSNDTNAESLLRTINILFISQSL